MNTIHFIGGNRGNIGKSFFTTLLCHFYQACNRSFTLFDTDPHKKDVLVMYQGIGDVCFDACNEIMVNHSEDVSKIDRIYEEALNQDVIVNMPSDSHQEMLFWLTQNGLDNQSFLTESNIQIHIWYLSNGDNSSLELLKKLVEKYSVFKTFLIRNKGIDNQWHQYEASRVAEAEKSKSRTKKEENPIDKIPTMTLDVMPRAERQKTFILGKTYADYISNQANGKLSINRLTKYLNTQSAKFYQLFSLAPVA